MEFIGDSKRFLIGGNWKCNGTIAKMKEITEIINNGGQFPEKSEVVVAVPSIHLASALSLFRKDVSVCSEDCAIYNGVGAYTGEISADLLKDLGINWTLAGHSERRAGFCMPGETSEIVAKKTVAGLKAGLNVILCIGETLVARESGETMNVLVTQLSAVTKEVKPEDWTNIVIAYEPVWAIGTGKVATPEQAEETHIQIRQWIATNVSPEIAKTIRIIYGGSVNGKNCATLIACPNIDGFLVGGAALKPEFVDIIKCPSTLDQ